jgi:hypothetical protein
MTPGEASPVALAGRAGQPSRAQQHTRHIFLDPQYVSDTAVRYRIIRVAGWLESLGIDLGTKSEALLVWLPAHARAPFQMLMPVFGMLAGTLLLDEPLTALKVIGGAAIVIGVSLIVLRPVVK